jgi:hypothetical protein
MSDAAETPEDRDATPEVEGEQIVEPEVTDAPTAGAEVTNAEVVSDEPEPLPEPDLRLLEAHDLALKALHEITPPSTVGEPAGHSVEPDGVVSLRFENRMLGYPGWYWTVSLAVVEGSEPTVLEVELLPGGDALLAPEWVPWAVRLKEYQAAQAAAVEAAATTSEDTDEDLDEDDELDEDGSPILHAGDVDGVDIDTLDPDEQGGAAIDDLDEDDDDDSDDDDHEDEDEDVDSDDEDDDSDDEDDDDLDDDDDDEDDDEDE